MFADLRNKVGIKIIAGILSSLSIVFIASIVLITRLEQLSNTVSKLATNEAVNLNRAGELVSQVALVRHFSVEYIQHPDQASIDQYNQAFQDLNAIVAESRLRQTREIEANTLTTIDQAVQEYGVAFSETIQIIQKQQQIQSSILDVNSLAVEKSLAALQVELSSSKDPAIFLALGNAQSAFLFLKINSIKYLENGDERFALLAEQNYIDSINRFSDLKNILVNPDLTSYCQKAQESLSNYYQGLQDMRQEYAIWRELISRLDPLEKQIEQDARKIEGIIEANFQAANASTQKSVRETLNFLNAVVIIALSVGFLIGGAIARQITHPLGEVMRTSQQIARQDLTSLTYQLEKMSTGALAIDLHVGAQPLHIHAKDEIGQMALAFNAIITQLHKAGNAFREMAAYLSEMAQAAASIARGNLDVAIHPRSADDVLGNAVAGMVASLRQANQKVQVQLDRLAALRQIDSLINTNLDLQTTLDFITSQVCTHLEITFAEIYLHTNTGSLVSKARSGSECIDEQSRQILARVVLQKAINVKLESLEYLNIPSPIQRPDLAYLGIPLMAKDQIIGIIHAFNFSPINSEQEFLETLAGQAAIAIENANLFHGLEERVAMRTWEIEQRALQAQAAAEITHASSGMLDLDQLLQQSADLICERFELDYVGIYLLEGEIEPLAVLKAAAGPTGPQLLQEQHRFPVDDTSVVGWCIQNIQPSLVSDVSQEIRKLSHPLLPQSGSKVTLPLITRSEVIGALTVQTTRPNAFFETDLSMLQTMAGQIANAISNARLYANAQREKTYFESLLMNNPGAIVVVNMEDQVISWNPSATQLFGYSQEETQGRDLNSLIATEALLLEAKSFSQKASKGELVHAITRRCRKDGSMVDVELFGVPVFMEGKEVGALAIYHDITELLHARQAAEAANQAKSAFLATMSHEIRTPMNAIIGMTGLLLETQLSTSQRDFIDTVRISGDSLLAIINDILDFSKIEANRMELEFQPFKLFDCMESALDLVAMRAAEKGLDISYFIENNVPQAIVGDVTRLRQILINLLTNSVKFTEHGEVTLSVSLAPKIDNKEDLTDGEACLLHFQVRDTGIGIAPQHMERLFKSFSQVDASTTRRYGGTGLGLAISKRLSELMGGGLWVESEGIPGKGSIFHFTIVAQVAQNIAPSKWSGDQPLLRGRKVLIVDDNPTNRQILSLQTSSWGMLPTSMVSPLEVLEHIQGGDSYDLGILDFQMPEMDGQELAQNIRNIPGGEKFPLVMLSSLGRPTSQVPPDLFAACLLKPIKPSALCNTLMEIFGSHPVISHRQEVSTLANLIPGKHAPLRILLAEDHAINQKVALLLLERLGYRADVAANGLEVLQALIRQPYDVVLMDVQMPEMDGLETTRQIHTQWSAEDAPHIIAVTANAMESDRQKCLDAGMDDYIAKPIQITDLAQVLGNCPPTRFIPAQPEELIRPAWLVQANETATVMISPAEAINRNVLDENFQGIDSDTFKEMIEMFLEDSPAGLVKLSQVIQKGELELTRIAAHTLKGTSKTFGAVGISDLCKKIETLTRDGGLDGASQIVDQIELELERAKDELRRIISIG